ncbi:MAG: RluA family pseudouridine synthase, partial [Myxococcales bacterium]|nr:RluA family pseudouridine synthase [Myxococcales bacterium]
MLSFPPMEINDNAETLELTVPEGVEPARIDRWLADQPELADRGVTRSRIQGFIQDGLVYLGMRPAKASDRVRGGERVLVSVPEIQDLAAEPQDIKIDIVYQDADLAVVDKPAGMVTHPAKGSPDGTLVNALLHHIGDLSGIGGVIRPGIVHRLD